MRGRETAARVLTCVECGRVSFRDAERGWRAYLTVDDADDDEPVEAVVYCPECAGREFGQRVPRTRDGRPGKQA